METKTKQQIVNEAKAYLTKTSRHLFVTADGYMYKIESFERDGKLYFATIFMGNNKVIINVKEAVSDRQYAHAGNNALNSLKHELFPKYYKVKSLPYFKKMRNIVVDILAEVKVDNSLNSKLGDKFKDRLPELEMTK